MERNRHLIWAACALMTLACGTCGGEVPLVAEDNGVSYAGAFTHWDCPIDFPDDQTVQCGYLTVPERHDIPDGDTIQLAVAIIHPPNAAADPLVYLSGGPGNSAIDEYLTYPDSWRSNGLLDNHTFILVDQRGTGFSQPTLDCPEYDDDTYEDWDYYEITLACRDRLLAEGIDLTAYNSQQSAADLALLRETLGYDQWNLLGISYGTRLALTIMRDHPAGVRSVILDSVYPPHVDSAVEEAPSILAAYRTLFAGCAADPACNAAYPNLEQVTLEMIDTLNADPLEIEYTDPYSGEVVEETYDGDDLIHLIFLNMYDAFYLTTAPRLIYEAWQGETDFLVQFSEYDAYDPTSADRVDYTDRSDAEGIPFSVECREEYAYTDYPAYRDSQMAEIPDAYEYDLFEALDDYMVLCPQWGAGVADPIETQPVVSDIPTLVLAGSYDPITPPRWGRETANYLTTAYYVEFSSLGHGVVYTACPVQIVRAFLATPTTPPDTSCVNSMPPPDWFLPGDKMEY